MSIGNTEWLLCYKSVSQTCFSGEKACFHRERWLGETPPGSSSRPRIKHMESKFQRCLYVYFCQSYKALHIGASCSAFDWTEPHHLSRLLDHLTSEAWTAAREQCLACERHALKFFSLITKHFAINTNALFTKKQLIWVFEWRKSIHYWWSYILFAPECKELTYML